MTARKQTRNGQPANYNATPPTLDDLDESALLVDENQRLVSTLGTTIAGEDIANDVLKVEQRFLPLAITADTLVKTGVGVLHTLTFSPNDATPTAGSIIVYDSLTEAGTQIYNLAVAATWFVPFSLTFDTAFTTGLYVGFTTTADVNVTVSYR